MAVELIGDNAPKVLDLTGGSNADDDKNPSGDAGDDLAEQEGAEGEPAPAAEGGEEVAEGDDAGAAGDAADADPAGDDGADADEFFYGGVAVTVDAPPEITNALKEAGIEVKDITAQLFRKDGDFTLDEDTYKKLEEKFGKVMVDGYLNMYKTMNDQALQKHEADKVATEETEKRMQTEYAEAVGGEEGLVKIEDYIRDNFTDDQIAAYNAVMESDSHASHLLILSQVKAQMALQDKLQHGDKNIKLLGDKSAGGSEEASPLDKGYLTHEEYDALISVDKYWDDPDYMRRVDAARIAGQKRSV